ncbi:phospholipase [Nostoc sp. 'Peltigera membranacea cyanobiont' 213]|uniref:carboxylesterase family protein n=1 Tax=unclassified Nostoc TaxID=2593658 RepID=UPI000B958546|nr:MULTISPECIES: prolyl oligopeptidase family serine peptidase [unclassified Nostoc]AVH65005.1 phospholipase/carboxylesterase [Nostoc sp. 'Peltigera membranacea cyanobiont' N6]OYD87648.1 phospholipase [Nostoc sp. 'Peltigera membranacea cyanobiont' 213]
MPPLQRHVTSTDSYNYLLFLPDGLHPDGDRNEIQQALLPTILFLHGAGQRGSDLDDVRKHGVAKVVEQQSDFPFIVISPQCPRREYWNIERLSTLLDEVIASCAVDPDRVYLTGLSMGGYGTWHLAAAQPERFAAIAPICGGGNPQAAGKLKNLPVWAFHGAKDNVVPLSESEIMVSALKVHDGNVKFTVYPEANHDSWTQTYNNPELYEWFLQHWRQQTVG